MTSNVTSKCPYGLCDGSGLIYDAEINAGIFCKCYEQRRLNNKMKFAQIPSEFQGYKIKDFDTDIYNEKNKNAACAAKKTAIEFVNKFDEFQKGGKGLYFYSETRGSGKTRLACSIGNALINMYFKNVRFTTTINLLNKLKSTFDKSKNGGIPTYDELIQDIKTVEVLILDDVGVETASEWVKEVFYSILNDRMTAKKVTLFTSNCRYEALQYDERTIERIAKMAIPIKFPEQSIRSTLAKKENEEYIKILMGGN